MYKALQTAVSSFLFRLVRCGHTPQVVSPWLLVLLCSLSLGCGNSNELADVEVSTPELKKSKLDLNLAFDLVLPEAADNESVLPVFEDVAAEHGLQFQYHSDEDSGQLYFPEVFGGGVACFDFDLDGWCDVFFPNGRSLPIDQPDQNFRDSMFKNMAGQFTDVTLEARIDGFQYSHGCSFGDINADGFEDLLVANYGTSQLFVNQGDGTFVQEKIEVLSSNTSWWMVPALADLDGDRSVDLLLLPYVNWTVDGPRSQQENGPGYPGPNEFDSLPMLAVKNNADGTWTDHTAHWGFDKKAKAMAVAIADFDNDLMSEVYVANDSTANQLFTRSRSLTFDPKLTNAARTAGNRAQTQTVVDPEESKWNEIGEISGTAAGLSGSTEASMSATVADFDLNGDPDLLVTNYFGRSNSLYANRGQLNFRNIAYSSRMDAIGKAVLTFGASPVDYDLDGDWDLVLANGHVLGKNAAVYRQSAQMLRNVDGAFIDVSSVAGDFFKYKSLGRSVATIDFDNDGDTDLIVTHADHAVSLLENKSVRRHDWISFEVMHSKNESTAGGRVEILVDQKKVMTVPMMVGGSYLSDSQRKWTIGLGDHKVVTLLVHWPNGTINQWDDLTANQVYRLMPGRLR